MPKIKIHTNVVEGDGANAADAIIGYSATLRRGAGVLLLGASGKGMARQEGSGTLPLGRTAEKIVLACKCPLLLVKARDFALDVQVKPTRPESLRIVMCAADGNTDRAAFDAAYHMCRPKDQWSVVHVQTDNNGAASAYWQAECDKLSNLCADVDITFTNLRKDRKATVDALCDFVEKQDAHICVLGSLELAKPKAADAKAIALGSISQAIAKRTRAHTLIVKNFSIL